MPRTMKMQKDGIVREVVVSAFRRSWVKLGWEAAEPDALVDPPELGLGHDEDLESYIEKRDKARSEAESRLEEADKALAAQAEADQQAVADRAAEHAAGQAAELQRRQHAGDGQDSGSSETGDHLQLGSPAPTA